MARTAVAVLAGQLELFAGLAAPAPAARKPWSRKRKAAASPLFEQLAFDLRPPPVWVDPDDEPEPGDFPEHIVVPAAGREMPKTTAATSIFDLGARHAAQSVIAEFTLAHRRPALEKPESFPVRHARIVREGGVTRHVAMRVQETDEWQEKERARRARQVLPKPPRQKFKLGGARDFSQ